MDMDMDSERERRPILQGEYKLVKLLECYDYSNLFLAVSLHSLDRKFAIKEVRIDGSPGSETHRQIMKYFRQVAAPYVEVQHPGLTTLRDYFYENGSEYVVFDYIQGYRLGEVMALRHRPFLEAQAVDVAVKIGVILDWMHNRRPPLYFADLNPANVLLTPRGDVVLTDFGLGRLLAPHAPDEPRLGTRGYAPPEQCGSEAVVTRTNDIYTLGVLMHQMVTGHDPTIRPGELAPCRGANHSISEDLEAIVKKATHPDPAQRYLDVVEMLVHLKALAPKKLGTPENRTGFLERLCKVLARPFTDPDELQ